MVTRSSTSMTLDEIRAILSDEIHKIRDGETSAAAVNAVSNATGKILSSVKLEMEYFKMVGKTPNIPLLGGDANSKERKPKA